MNDEQRRRAASFRRLADASAIGLAFPIAILLGYFFGRYVDAALGTAPWATYVFSAFGIGAGFLNAIRMGLRLGREEDTAARARGEGAVDGIQGSGNEDHQGHGGGK